MVATAIRRKSGGQPSSSSLSAVSRPPLPCRRGKRRVENLLQRSAKLRLRPLRATGEPEPEPSETSLARVNGSAGFAQLERAITERLSESNLIPEESGWEQVEGCWCLDPSSPDSKSFEPIEPKALVHFVGGAFAGASPQLTYRYFLERLASKGFFVVSTPFETNFEHLKIADDIHLKYTQCIKALGTRVEGLQTIGIGHSLGALEQLLLCSRYKNLNTDRAGNVLISFNNKPVTDAIPFYAELIAPASSQFVAPLLQQLETLPQTRMVNSVVDNLREQTPDFIQKNVFPLIDQLAPIYEDIAQDRIEFTPTPEESRAYVEKRYACTRNLLLQFQNDTIDETPILADTLQKTMSTANASAEGSLGLGLELTVKQLAGDHITPCKQPPAVIEDGVSQISEQSKSFFGGVATIAGMAQGLSGSTIFSDNVNNVTSAVQKGIDQIATDFNTNLLSASEVEQVDQLADVITQWSGIEPRIVRNLPAPAKD